MKENVDKLLAKEKFDKIFLCTEENYLDFFKKNYPDKLLFIDTFRSNKMMLLKNMKDKIIDIYWEMNL